MSSSNSPATALGARTVEALPSSVWAPRLDLTPQGMSAFDPARVEQAVDDGYEAGFSAGRAEALARGDEQIGAELDRFRAQAQVLFQNLDAAARQVAAAEARTAQAFADTVADAAVALASAILGRELSEETAAAAAAIDRVVAAVGRREQVWVQVHPEDLELLADVELPQQVHVEANPGLRRGDAVARTDDRTVDARIGAALERARTALEASA